jgi:hypothetical protein
MPHPNTAHEAGDNTNGDVERPWTVIVNTLGGNQF